MIKRLHIENYLLIDKLDIDFASELNIITGETGAGKSILLGAISMLLGAKADSKNCRVADKNCVIEAQFDIENFGLQQLFAENDVEYEDETIISRVILPSGKSRAYINDLPVTLSVLKVIGERLIDIHSQHQTLLLSQENFQIGVIDSIAKNSKLLADYTVCFNELKRAKLRLSKLRDDSAKNMLNYDFIKFQYEELESANITIGEIESAEGEYAILSNASEIKEIFFNATNSLDGEESSIISTLKIITNSFERVSKISSVADSLQERISTLLYELKDINSEAYSYADTISDDPERLADLEERISKVNRLLLKHNVATEKELIEIREDLEVQLENIDLSSMHIENCEREIAELTVKGEKLADAISEKRLSVVSKIENYAEKQLKGLGMESSRLRVVVERGEEFLSSGMDRVRFFFSANKGVDLQPIEKVASGGEMSRVMLTIKSLTAAYKKLPTIIFDEIDTGVSGNVADKMGEIMKKLSNSLQIICITHLPQVASKGSSHFVVKKSEKNGSTLTTIISLSETDRVEVIAKMLSGSVVTEAARSQADLLLFGEK